MSKISPSDKQGAYVLEITEIFCFWKWHVDALKLVQVLYKFHF